MAEVADTGKGIKLRPFTKRAGFVKEVGVVYG